MKTRRTSTHTSIARTLGGRLVAAFLAVPTFILISLTSLPLLAGPIVIDGTDANDHGSVSGGVNQQGWRYMQKVLDNLAPQVGNGNKIVVDLGTVSGSQARNAIQSAFALSTLPSAGWSIVHFSSVAQIQSFLAGGNVLGAALTNTGIIYIPTYFNTGGDLYDVGGFSATAMNAVNAGASAIASFVGGAGNPFAGGGLFAMTEEGFTGSWGWLTTLLPGLNHVAFSDTGIYLTPDGATAFPGITTADLSAGPWHNYFSGSFGSLKVLGRDTQQNLPVILGGGASTIISEILVTPPIATNIVGSSHTVCASAIVVTNGVTNVLVGTTVNFDVTNGPNAAVNGTSVTDTNGVACFTYVGSGGVGVDTIDASFVDPTGNPHSGTAIKVWIPNPNHPPVAVGYAALVVDADPTNCTANADANNGSFDPDNGDSITNVVQTPPGPYPLGTNNVTLCVTDSHGVTSCTNSVIIVRDVTPPVIACPSDIVVGNDAGQCGAVVTFSTPSAMDTCDSQCEINVNIYSGFSTAGGGAPFSGLVGSFTATSVSFATDFGYSWHPLGLTDFGADITGCLTVAAEGDYSFALNSDDGSLLYIDGNLVVDDGSVHPPVGGSGSVHLTAGSHTFEVQFFECCGDPSGVDLQLPAGVSYGGVKPLLVTCDPPSGSTFAVGTNVVTCCAVDASGNTNCCQFNVIVQDTEPPVAECREGYNPSGKKIPVAGKNPASGQNPDGYYQLLSRDNCDSDPAIYVADTGSDFIAGPFHSGDVVKLTQSPGKTPSQDAAPAPIVAHLHFRGDGLIFAIDANGNQSQGQLCLVPRPPK